MRSVHAPAFASPASNSAASDPFDLLNLSLNSKVQSGICEVSCVLIMCVFVEVCAVYIYIILFFCSHQPKIVSLWTKENLPLVPFLIFSRRWI